MKKRQVLRHWTLLAVIQKYYENSLGNNQWRAFDSTNDCAKRLPLK